MILHRQLQGPTKASFSWVSSHQNTSLNPPIIISLVYRELHADETNALWFSKFLPDLFRETTHFSIMSLNSLWHKTLRRSFFQQCLHWHSQDLIWIIGMRRRPHSHGGLVKATYGGTKRDSQFTGRDESSSRLFSSWWYDAVTPSNNKITVILQMKMQFWAVILHEVLSLFLAF